MRTNLKPTSQMTEQEPVAHLKIQFEAEDVFAGVLGNKNSFFIAEPVRRRQAAVRGKRMCYPKVHFVQGQPSGPTKIEAFTTKAQASAVYASDADLLTLALFGQTVASNSLA